jgi:Leucine rich repeat
LVLAENLLTTLEAYFFNGVKALKKLDLSYNQIRILQLEVFKNLANLIILKLNNNLINTLATYSNEVISCCSTIEKLDLRNNSLVKVHNLKNFAALKMLDLSDNLDLDVTTVPFFYLANLVFLSLNNANLNDNKKLKFLEKAKNLRNLSIARNQLRLDFSKLPIMPNLEYININKLEFVHHDLIKQHLPNLKFISMTSRLWNCSYVNGYSSFVEENSIIWLNRNSSQCKQDQTINKAKKTTPNNNQETTNYYIVTQTPKNPDQDLTSLDGRQTTSSIDQVSTIATTLNIDQSSRRIDQDSELAFWIALPITGISLAIVVIVIIVCYQQKLEISRFQAGVEFHEESTDAEDEGEDADYCDIQEFPFGPAPVESEYMDVGDGF